ncbi:MAG: endonuclease MutS2, partial [Thermicanus sp.]|nr:endonuclease MutS2 [Thermicanus sp.]
MVDGTGAHDFPTGIRYNEEKAMWKLGITEKAGKIGDRRLTEKSWLKRTVKVLEFDKVIEQAMRYASSSLARERMERLTPFFTYEEVEEAQEATAEGVTVYRLRGEVPLGGIHDIRPSIRRARMGGVLSPQEFLDLADTLAAGRRLKHFLLELAEREPLPILQRYAERIEGLKPLETEIRGTVDEYGEVLDGASPLLRKIRQEIRGLEGSIKQKLESLIRDSSYQKMIQESVVTIRNDRYVIPVKQEYRTSFGGLVHDQSSSGATLFIEPEAVVRLNNELREAKLKEEREIERILRELSGKVALAAGALKGNVEALAELDFIFTKAKYAMAIKAVRPALNGKKALKLKRARHPLIPKEKVVPIDVEVGDSFTMLVITGPNTGGKTVTLKTIGLMTLMAQAGLQIPAGEGSEVSVFSQVFADIGDEQSIEQSLSTFSSHMTHIVKIIEEMTPDSLILLDELGAGTDPTEGAALAIAILDHFSRRGARVVATTHYSELKVYAYNHPQVMNASVEFDVETLSPTYRLLLGVPGRSNAFSIAQRLGLPAGIIEKAKAQVDEESREMEQMIANLTESRKEAEMKREEAERIQEEMVRLRNALQEEKERLERERERLLKEAAREAEEVVKKARREAEEVIQELRRLGEEEGARIKEHRLIEARKRLDEAIPTLETGRRERGAVLSSPHGLKVGDEVYVHSLKLKG